MASTYENDLRLEEMATGENSGSWGTKTNTNLELIADAFSYGTETIADADTTITIADGAADAARSLALKINSSADLTTTRTITLAPNTTSKVWIIENNTSGGQTLTISAGSGSNITLANGTTKIIATDGIGAGSNVVELTQDLAIADLFVDDDLTVGDDIIMNSDGAKIDFGSDSEIQLTHVADTGLLLTETGGGAPTLQLRDSALAISSSADGQLDIDSDGTIDINATTSIAFDTDTLFVDSANDRVGINEATPLEALHVTTSDSGTTISKTVGSTSGPVFVLDNTDDTTNNLAAIQFASSGSSSAAVIATTGIYSINTGRGGTYSYGDLAFYTTGSGGSHDEAMRIDSSQRVLIGTDTARSTAGHTAQLQVEGSGSFSEATVSIVGNENNTNGAYINFGKSRGTTTGSNTIVQDGDVSGQIQFTVADGTDMVSRVAAITAKVDGAPGVDDTPGLLDFSTTIAGASDPTLRMRITNSGNVGIGTANPNFYSGYTTLTINGTSGGLIDFETNGTFVGEVYADSTDGIGMQAVGPRSIKFVTNSSNAMIIDSSQRVLMGAGTDATSTITNGWWNGSTLYSGILNVQNVNDGSAQKYVSLAVSRHSNDSESGQLGFAKSRATVANGKTIVQSDDSIGIITFQGADGVNLVEAARVAAASDGTPASDDMPGRLVFATTSGGAASPTERMRINNAGDVTIGNAADARARLEVYDSGVSAVYDAGDLSTWRVMQVRNNIESATGTAAGIAFGGDGSGDTETAGIVGISDNSTGGIMQLAFLTATGNNSIEAMRIDSNGALLLGTTSRSIYYNSVNVYNASAVIKTNVSNEVADLVITNGNNDFGSSVDFARTNSAGNDVRFATISAQPTNNTAGSEAGVIRFYTKDTGDSNVVERMRIQAGGGISFNGDTAAANALNDYEEGTFDINIYGSSSGSTTYTQSANVMGQYTKIGQLVHVTIMLNSQTWPTFTGDIRVNLPFTQKSSNSASFENRSGDVYFYPLGSWDNVANFMGFVFRVEGGASYGTLGLLQVDADRQTTAGSTNTPVSGDSGVYFRTSIVYETDS